LLSIVFSSFNRGKRAEVAALLSHLDIRVLSPADFGLDALPPETGDTFLDNAVIKAVAGASVSGLLAVADDSGLEVAALGGLPGVNSARFAGDGHDDSANNTKLLAMLAGEADRSARFVCTTALVIPPGLALPHVESPVEGVKKIDSHALLPEGWTLYSTCGAVSGVIIDEHRGTDGFGYDPIFFRPELGLTFAQIPQETKNALSHRGQAFSRLVPMISKLV